MTESNLEWHSYQHIHESPKDPCWPLCWVWLHHLINAHKCFDKEFLHCCLSVITLSKPNIHQVDWLLYFIGMQHHPSMLNLYIWNNWIWINESCFQTVSAINSKAALRVTPMTSIQGPQNNHNKEPSMERLLFFYLFTLQQFAVKKQQRKLSTPLKNVHRSHVSID